MIKPGDTLLFEVELLGFHEKAKEKWEMSAAELMEEAAKLKVGVLVCFEAYMLFIVRRLVPKCPSRQQKW